jgi:N-acetylglucosaminyl-diphospho-decaprenol L-rhamnosyltransferase
VSDGRVSLVIVNYATMDRALALARSAREAVDEVIVVDNASFRGDRESISDDLRGVRFVWLDDNRGYGAGANAGAAAASGDVLVVSNADIGIEGADLARLAAAAAAGGGLVAPRFVDPAGELIRSSHRREPFLLATLREYCAPLAAAAARIRPGWHPTLRGAADHHRDHDALHVLGALMAVDARTFAEVGGFDESFFLYREETDLCRRVRSAGRPVRHLAGAVAVHEGDAASPGAILPVAVRAAAVESHYRYIAKHGGRVLAALLWLVGGLGSVVWALTGPDRTAAAASLRSHRRAWRAVITPGCGGPIGRGAGRRPSPPA